MHQTFADMKASLGGYWDQAESYQKFLYVVGALLILSAAFHAGVLLLTGGSWEGDVSWRKPILFGESFGLTAVSLAWVMTFLPRWRWRGWLLALALGVANTYEVVWVSIQQWRGVPSHFNDATDFDAALFAAAGAMILVAAIVIVTVTLLAFFTLKAPPSLAWAIRLGLLVLIAGQAFGQRIIQEGDSTFGAAGALKVPHALSVHGPQVLPLLAWLLLFTPWSERRRTGFVFLAAAGYALLIGVSAVQTFSGRAPLDLGPATAVLLGVGGIAVAGAYLAGLAALRRSPA